LGSIIEVRVPCAARLPLSPATPSEPLAVLGLAWPMGRLAILALLVDGSVFAQDLPALAAGAEASGLEVHTPLSTSTAAVSLPAAFGQTTTSLDPMSGQAAAGGALPVSWKRRSSEEEGANEQEEKEKDEEEDKVDGAQGAAADGDTTGGDTETTRGSFSTAPPILLSSPVPSSTHLEMQEAGVSGAGRQNTSNASSPVAADSIVANVTAGASAVGAVLSPAAAAATATAGEALATALAGGSGEAASPTVSAAVMAAHSSTSNATADSSTSNATADGAVVGASNATADSAVMGASNATADGAAGAATATGPEDSSSSSSSSSGSVVAWALLGALLLACWFTACLGAGWWLWRRRSGGGGRRRGKKASRHAELVDEATLDGKAGVYSIVRAEEGDCREPVSREDAIRNAHMAKVAGELEAAQAVSPQEQTQCGSAQALPPVQVLLPQDRPQAGSPLPSLPAGLLTGPPPSLASLGFGPGGSNASGSFAGSAPLPPLTGMPPPLAGAGAAFVAVPQSLPLLGQPSAAATAPLGAFQRPGSVKFSVR